MISIIDKIFEKFNIASNNKNISGNNNIIGNNNVQNKYNVNLSLAKKYHRVYSKEHFKKIKENEYELKISKKEHCIDNPSFAKMQIIESDGKWHDVITDVAFSIDETVTFYCSAIIDEDLCIVIM